MWQRDKIQDKVASNQAVEWVSVHKWQHSTWLFKIPLDQSQYAKIFALSITVTDASETVSGSNLLDSIAVIIAFFLTAAIIHSFYDGNASRVPSVWCLPFSANVACAFINVPCLSNSLKLFQSTHLLQWVEHVPSTAFDNQEQVKSMTFASLCLW